MDVSYQEQNLSSILDVSLYNSYYSSYTYLAVSSSFQSELYSDKKEEVLLLSYDKSLLMMIDCIELEPRLECFSIL